MQYSTVQGDAWDEVSKKVYGTELNAHILRKANHDYSSIVKFPAGVDLVVPEVDDVEEFDDLPPWKRGVS